MYMYMYKATSTVLDFTKFTHTVMKAIYFNKVIVNCTSK